MPDRTTPGFGKPWVILLADRRYLGGVVKVVSKGHTSHRPELARRFPTKVEADRWLSKLPKDHRIRARFRPVVERL